MDATDYAFTNSAPQNAQCVQPVSTARWHSGQAVSSSAPQRGQKTKSSCTGDPHCGQGLVTADAGAGRTDVLACP